MAIGISGSNGGISEAYRKLEYSELSKILSKYEGINLSCSKKSILEEKGLLKKLENVC